MKMYATAHQQKGKKRGKKEKAFPIIKIYSIKGQEKKNLLQSFCPQTFICNGYPEAKLNLSVKSFLRSTYIYAEFFKRLVGSMIKSGSLQALSGLLTLKFNRVT